MGQKLKESLNNESIASRTPPAISKTPPTASAAPSIPSKTPDIVPPITPNAPPTPFLILPRMSPTKLFIKHCDTFTTALAAPITNDLI